MSFYLVLRQSNREKGRANEFEFENVQNQYVQKAFIFTHMHFHVISVYSLFLHSFLEWKIPSVSCFNFRSSRLVWLGLVTLSFLGSWKKMQTAWVDTDEAYRNQMTSNELKIWFFQLQKTNQIETKSYFLLMLQHPNCA